MRFVLAGSRKMQRLNSSIVWRKTRSPDCPNMVNDQIFLTPGFMDRSPQSPQLIPTENLLHCSGGHFRGATLPSITQELGNKK